MKAIYLVQYGQADQAFKVQDINTPLPNDNEVLIKVDAFGLNYADVMARNGLYKDAPPNPAILGYEVVGVIDKIGKNVKGLQTGQRVVAFTRFGAYAEYAIADERAIAPLPSETTNGEGLALATQYCTAIYSAYEMVNLHKGDNILVHAAAGGVGTAIVQLAKLKGCNVYGTASSSEKLEYLKSIGVDFPIN